MRGWDELMAWHREHGSLVPELLQPVVSRPRMSAAESELGFDFHEGLSVLYALCDGVDVPAVASSHGAIAQIAPRIEFPGLADVVAPDLDTWLTRTSERLGQADAEMFRGLTPRIRNEDVTSAFFLRPVT